MKQPPLTSIVLLAEDATAAKGVLAGLVEQLSADAAILLLRSGEIALSQLDEPIRNVESLGALIAGNFASAREIARMLGDSHFEAQVQQGSGRHIVTQSVGAGWILALVFRQSESLGLVRMLAQRAATELAPLYERAASWSAGSRPSVPPALADSAAKVLDAWR